MDDYYLAFKYAVFTTVFILWAVTTVAGFFLLLYLRVKKITKRKKP